MNLGHLFSLSEIHFVFNHWLIKTKGLIQISLTTNVTSVGALLTLGFYLLLIMLLMKTLILLNDGRCQVKQLEMFCYSVNRALVSQ